MADKSLPGNETVLLIPALEVNGVPFAEGTTLVQYDSLTTAVLNLYAAITTEADSGSGAGGNISWSIRDDMKLGLTDSDTDKDRTIVQSGNAENLTFFNFEADFNMFRDVNPVSTASNFVLAHDLVRAPDLPYLVVHRVGKAPDAVFAVGDEFDVYYVWTDEPIDGYSDGGNQLVGQTFVPKNIVSVGQVAAA